jgi:hypothetical protein
MSGRVRLIVAVIVATATVAGGVPVAAQQQGAPAVRAGQAGLSASIQGTAVNWTNTPLANAPVRLRNARNGRVLDSMLTNRFGAFGFRGLEPGSYVVELMSAGHDAVLATTPIINVDSDQTVAALIKLPFRSPPAGGALGKSLPTVLAVTAAAVAAGVLATSVTGAPVTDRALPGQP